MNLRRISRILLAPAAGILLTLSLAAPASAVTAAQKATLLANWTQPNAASSNAWLSAEQNQGAWAAYAFDWSTDYCSDSPDEPLGFDFRMPCYHHDFGYRNFKAIGTFPANKSHVDDMFYFDLRTKCATYNVFVRPACNSLAWTYYQAVKAFGSIAVSQADYTAAATLKSAGLRSQQLASQPN